MSTLRQEPTLREQLKQMERNKDIEGVNYKMEVFEKVRDSRNSTTAQICQIDANIKLVKDAIRRITLTK